MGCAGVCGSGFERGVSVGAGGLLLLSGLRLVLCTDAVTSSMVDDLFTWLLAQAMLLLAPLCWWTPGMAVGGLWVVTRMKFCLEGSGAVCNPTSGGCVSLWLANGERSGISRDSMSLSQRVSLK
jgi:hypothetical protein